MYLQTLRGRVAKGVFELQADKEFQDRFAKDEVLNELDEQKIDYELEREMILAALGHKLIHKGKEFSHIKPWHMALLYTERSPLLGKDNEAVKIEDISYFLWILSTTKENCTNKEDSRHYLVLNYPDFIFEIPDVIGKLFKIAFYPLTFIPKIEKKLVGADESCYDFDWLIHTIYDCGIPFEKALDTPLCVLTSIFVQKLKGNPQLSIGRPPTQEIMKQQDYRMCEMVTDRLIEKGILEPEKREEFILTLTTKPEQAKTDL